jgi:hypothetical protein
VPFLAPEVRRGELKESEGTDREDDHPEGIHGGHRARWTGDPKPGERHVVDRPDDVRHVTGVRRSATRGAAVHRSARQAVGVEMG